MFLEHAKSNNYTMKNKKYLLDTNILIEFIHGNKLVISRMLQLSIYQTKKRQSFRPAFTFAYLHHCTSALIQILEQHIGLIAVHPFVLLTEIHVREGQAETFADGKHVHLLGLHATLHARHRHQ